MPVTMSRDSTDDILIPVGVAVAAGSNPDITLDVVEFAFVAGGLPSRHSPADSDWVTGFWLTGQQSQIFACCTIGPNGVIQPTIGAWAIWVRIHDNPTTPVAGVDTLRITV